MFFYSPSQLQTQHVGDRNFRLGGLVEEGSVKKQPDGVTTAFRVTDTANTVDVRYRGQLPDLFREGEGVIAEGRLDGQGGLTASAVLAKHDESYMPPDMTDELKRSGIWQHKPERP